MDQNEQNSNGDAIITSNSEILFIYDARMCNPNGDPDDENKPRMDYDRGINLVSDVRLKRYIRDYLMDYKNESIFVCKVDGSTVDATGRLKYLYFLSNVINALDNNGNINKPKINIKINTILEKKLDNGTTREEGLKQFIGNLKTKGKDFKKPGYYSNLSKVLNLSVSGSSSDLKDITDTDIAKISNEVLLSELTDVRFFGATMPIKSDTGAGSSRTFTGPIQFNWGYSLNKVTGSMESNGITSTFGGATDEYSTMGKDYRVNYSIIAFHGIVSAKRAEHTYLKTKDINLFDEAMIKAIPLEATTRSKTGQAPLLYIRVEYNNSEFFLGDLRRYVKLTDKDKDGTEISFDKSVKLSSPKEYKLDLSDLKTKLEKHEDKIASINFWKHEDIEIKGYELNANGDGKKRTIKINELM